MVREMLLLAWMECGSDFKGPSTREIYARKGKHGMLANCTCSRKVYELKTASRGLSIIPPSITKANLPQRHSEWPTIKQEETNARGAIPMPWVKAKHPVPNSCQSARDYLFGQMVALFGYASTYSSSDVGCVRPRRRTPQLLQVLSQLETWERAARRHDCLARFCLTVRSSQQVIKKHSATLQK
jgi:hypothetical protein